MKKERENNLIEITSNNKLIAIIIYSNFKKDGIHFFTPDNLSQQLAYMSRPKDYQIVPHTHKEVPRHVTFTLETLLIRSGKVKVDLYNDENEYLESYQLQTGDVIFLASGGHGFTMLEDSEIIEVKQGPYAGINDKINIENPKKNN